MSGIELYRVGGASTGGSGGGGLIPVMHLKTNEVAQTYTYEDGRQIYRYVFYVSQLVDEVGVIKEYAFSTLPANVKMWIDPAYSLVKIGDRTEPLNLNRDSVSHAAFWLEDGTLRVLTPTVDYLAATAEVCIAFVNLDDEPEDVQAITGEGKQAIRGESVFELWLKENGIVDTPDTHATNWAAFMLAIKGDNGAGDFIGEIVIASGEAPEGTLECDGSMVAIADFQDLADYLLAAVPSLAVGDGVNFYLPDLRDVFLRGKGTARSMMDLQQDALQNITGGVSYFRGSPEPDGTSNPAWGAFQWVQWATGAATIGTLKAWDTFTFDASRVARTADETRPINRAVRFCIRYAIVLHASAAPAFIMPASDNVVYSIHNGVFCEQCLIHDGT